MPIAPKRTLYHLFPTNFVPRFTEYLPARRLCRTRTSTGSKQDDMIRTVAVCGEVLLETMDQMLAFPLINTLYIWSLLTHLPRLDYPNVRNSRNKVLKKGEDSRKVSPSNSSKTTNVDMTSLVENVVEGIFLL